jgi:hypothetical protein
LQVYLLLFIALPSSFYLKDCSGFKPVLIGASIKLDRLYLTFEKARISSSLRAAEYSESNKYLIFKFERYLFLEGLKKVRIKVSQSVKAYSLNFNFEFKDATRDDIEFVVEVIVKSDHSEWTKYDYFITIKRFFRWMNKGKDPEITAWIKPKV